MVRGIVLALAWYVGKFSMRTFILFNAGSEQVDGNLVEKIFVNFIFQVAYTGLSTRLYAQRCYWIVVNEGLSRVFCSHRCTYLASGLDNPNNLINQVQVISDYSPFHPPLSNWIFHSIWPKRSLRKWTQHVSAICFPYASDIRPTSNTFWFRHVGSSVPCKTERRQLQFPKFSKGVKRNT